MVKIRLAMNKSAHSFRVVAADSRSPRDGKFLEKLGMYNPRLPDGSPDRCRLDVSRINEWISQGAQPSERVLWLMKKYSN